MVFKLCTHVYAFSCYLLLCRDLQGGQLATEVRPATVVCPATELEEVASADPVLTPLTPAATTLAATTTAIRPQVS